MNQTYPFTNPVWDNYPSSGGGKAMIPMFLFVFGVSLLMFLFLLIFRRRTALPWSVAVLTFLACIGVGVYRGWQFQHRQLTPEILASVIAAGLLPLFAVPFVFKLYERWVTGRLSDAEKTPGMDGVRAWLQGGKFICALCIPLLAWLGFNESFWGVLALTMIALLAYPILNLASPAIPAVSPGAGDLSPERERVLRMLDEGKINVEESAELLNALGHTVQPPPLPGSTATNPHRKMVLTGLVLLLIGFFLPWYSINLSDEMGRVFSGMQAQVNEIAKVNPGISLHVPDTGTIHYAGGDIRYGLGWFVLLLGIAAAALPYIANTLDGETQHKAKLVILGIGSIILIYLLTRNIRFVSIGILLGLAGYALQWIGTLKERQGAAK